MRILIRIRLGGGTWELLPSGKSLQTTDSGAGKLIEAGLPNITGSVGENDGTLRRGLSGDFTGSFKRGVGNSRYSGSFSGQTGYVLEFDASRCSPIYGNSNTVQPPAYTVFAWLRKF